MRRWIGKYKLLISLVALALVAAGWIVARGGRTSADSLSEPLRKGRIMESVYGIGTVTATKSFQIRPGVTSTITKIFVREGDHVRRGQKLVSFGATTVFSAPFDGTVTELPCKEGENVFAQTAVLSLVDLLDRYLVVSLEQRAALRVRRGQKTKISFENMREMSYDGVVESVYSHDGNFYVRIRAPNLPAQVLPGMTADVSIGIGQPRESLVVPVAAIQGGRVTVKRGNKNPFTTSIRVGIVDSAVAEMVSGNLQEGDRLQIPRKAAP